MGKRNAENSGQGKRIMKSSEGERELKGWLRRSLGRTKREIGVSRRLGKSSVALAVTFIVVAFGVAPAQAAQVRPFLEDRSLDGSTTPAGTFNSACGVAVGPQGDVYVASKGTSAIDVFGPNEEYLTSINDKFGPCQLGVDSAGNVYVQERSGPNSAERVVWYAPESTTPFAGMKYSAPTVLVAQGANALAVNRGSDFFPGTDHVYVVVENRTGAIGSEPFEVKEFASPGSGSTLLREFGAPHGASLAIAISESNGGIYLVAKSSSSEKEDSVYVLSQDGASVVAETHGGNLARIQSIAVDKSNGNFLVDNIVNVGVVVEFDETGAVVGEISHEFPRIAGITQPAIAVDDSTAGTAGDVYVAAGTSTTGGLFAFGTPQEAGPPTIGAVGVAVGPGGPTTFSGTVIPGGVGVSACQFEYVGDADFQATEFADAATAPCAENAAEIGTGFAKVLVHASVGPLAPGQYHARLVATSAAGTGTGAAVAFGPPTATTGLAESSASEATLRGSVSADGLATSYHFEYGLTGNYEHSTGLVQLPGASAPAAIEAALFGLSPATTYHYRLVATNGLGTVVGTDAMFTTQPSSPPEACPNALFRTGFSASLPDCRAYELVSPADTNGLIATMAGTSTTMFATSPVSVDGESALFFTEGPLPGTDGNGNLDGATSTRGPSGWETSPFGPTDVETEGASQQGVSADHDFSFWQLSGGSLGAIGSQAFGYLFTRDGAYEPIGKGSLDIDLQAQGKFISSGASHVIFTSAVPLEPNSPAAGTTAIYDRTPGGATGLLSRLPNRRTPTESAVYQGCSPDGSSVVFTLGNTMYERRGGSTVEIATEIAPEPTNTTSYSFAGISQDGSRVFYSRGIRSQRELFVFNADSASSAEIAEEGTFVNVSADGSQAYFMSPRQLVNGKGAAGADNLYVWDGSSTPGFVATLDPRDFEKFGVESTVNLGEWNVGVGAAAAGKTGPAQDPSRTTPDGSVLVFQSHGVEGYPYDSNGHSEVYRYSAAEGGLVCISCNPSGEAAQSDAELQDLNSETHPVNAATLIPNITADGSTVFFQSDEALVGRDTNGLEDVYEWNQGRLSLISSGRSDRKSFLYGMTPNGHDVFIQTYQALNAEGRPNGGAMLYDARVGGGFAPPNVITPCQGELCQGPPGAPAAAMVPPSTIFEGPGNVVPKKQTKKKHKKRHHQKKKHKGTKNKKKHSKGKKTGRSGGKS
jgi:hypothetical protein